MKVQAQQMRSCGEELAGVIGGAAELEAAAPGPRALAQLPEGMVESRKRLPLQAGVADPGPVP